MNTDKNDLLQLSVLMPFELTFLCVQSAITTVVHVVFLRLLTFLMSNVYLFCGYCLLLSLFKVIYVVSGLQSHA